jgi:hypothetical protein
MFAITYDEAYANDDANGNEDYYNDKMRVRMRKIVILIKVIMITSMCMKTMIMMIRLGGYDQDTDSKISRKMRMMMIFMITIIERLQ